MAQNTANLHIMVKAARAAARGLLHDFFEVENLQASKKGASDFVSKADIRAEETIKSILMEARPSYGWLGEETGQTEGSDPTRFWIVDPLDGTTNFLRGVPHWAISIALEHRGEIVAGVIFDPVKNELFSAEKGAGAYVNDIRIRVAPRRDLADMFFGTGLPFNGRGDVARTLFEVGRVLPVCAGVRRMGAASLDIAYAAAGRFDGFWERDLSPWDIAAGDIIVREAGGYAQSLEGTDAPHRAGNIIAGSPDNVRLLKTLIS